MLVITRKVLRHDWGEQILFHKILVIGQLILRVVDTCNIVKNHFRVGRSCRTCTGVYYRHIIYRRIYSTTKRRAFFSITILIILMVLKKLFKPTQKRRKRRAPFVPLSGRIAFHFWHLISLFFLVSKEERDCFGISRSIIPPLFVVVVLPAEWAQIKTRRRKEIT